ncbi:hypothetical protein HOY82DRAFT_100983 [Tuber indicum]|nr:hypothetical protein HOY82DRAFT_100983 [Tuber indicum]
MSKAISLKALWLSSSSFLVRALIILAHPPGPEMDIPKPIPRSPGLRNADAERLLEDWDPENNHYPARVAEGSRCSYHTKPGPGHSTGSERTDQLLGRGNQLTRTSLGKPRDPRELGAKGSTALTGGSTVLPPPTNEHDPRGATLVDTYGNYLSWGTTFYRTVQTMQLNKCRLVLITIPIPLHRIALSIGGRGSEDRE